MMAGFSFVDFEKSVQNKIIKSATNICADIKNEYLREMEKEFEKFKSSCERLEQEYSLKMEEEVRKNIGGEIIQIAESIHFCLERDRTRDETNVFIRIG